MKTNVARKLIRALRSGKYRKTTGVLKTKDRNGESYCVLGVLCDLYKKDGKPLGEREAHDEESDRECVMLGGETKIPPQRVLNWAGIGETQAELLAHMNDGGDTFKRIATHIEKGL